MPAEPGPAGAGGCRRLGDRPSSSSWHYAQSVPDQDMPDQDIPDQDMPDQDIPDHDIPDHDIPDQDIPDQDIPDHDMPDQDIPDQFVPLRRPAAQLRALNFRPRTSTSPRTWRPLTVTCTDPREASREPAPVESRKLCTAFGVLAVRAAARSIRPSPCWAAVAPGSGAAVPMSRALTWSGRAFGRC